MNDLVLKPAFVRQRITRCKRLRFAPSKFPDKSGNFFYTENDEIAATNKGNTNSGEQG
jgi:hypothetical protein